MLPLSVGFPRMHKEPGEVRDFLPGLIHRLAPLAREIVLEEGCGADMNVKPARYTEGFNNVRFASNQACYEQDIVIQVRSPEDYEMPRIRPGAIIFSMLHYPTHPTRVQLMQELGLRPISMDSIVDDEGKRLVENIRGTSWNAIWAGFRALQKTLPDFDTRTRKVIEVVVVGTGPVGRFAAEAATKYGDVALHRALLLRGVPGVIVHLIGRNITQDRPKLIKLMSRADMFVDATFRSDPTNYIFPNDLIGELPEHAVVVDVTADPYITDTDPIQVKAIEGLPTGDLDEYEFPPDHPAFNALPDAVNTKHQRTTVSCYSWPGLNPKECMRRYGRQVGWMLDILLRKPYAELSVASTNYLERALYRGTLHAYLERQEIEEEQ